MKSILAAALATLVCTGNVFAGDAMAADGLRIESEAQFVRDYGDRIEQVGPGVYLIVSGELAGKTVSIGEAGLAYDIDLQRTRLAGTNHVKARTQVRAQIRQLENVRARYRQLHALQARDAGTKQTGFGSFSCFYSPRNGFPIWYSGYADVQATTELYLDNGGGGLNWYYARASATAIGYVYQPSGVPVSMSVSAGVHATNRLTGQIVQQSYPGTFSAYASTGYVYSGPAFSHDLFAVATVSGIGNCFGYVSISDTMQ